MIQHPKRSIRAQSTTDDFKFSRELEIIAGLSMLHTRQAEVPFKMYRCQGLDSLTSAGESNPEHIWFDYLHYSSTKRESYFLTMDFFLSDFKKPLTGNRVEVQNKPALLFHIGFHLQIHVDVLPVRL
jgi:hypothetical protein